MKRYLFIGSVDYSASCLKALLKLRINVVGIMCPYKSRAVFNSDYNDLSKVAAEFKKAVHYFKEINSEIKYIKTLKPDIIFVLGLSHIIPSEILSIPSIGCIGSHPALLPQNRGRHPIIWAIANGLKKSGITLFWMNSGIDSGYILAQKEFVITSKDNASTVYGKIEKISREMLKENIPDLERGIIKRVRQGNSRVNYWRKRVKKDGEIDWRMSSKRIYDLVRALYRPYPGASLIFNKREYKLWKVKIIAGAKKFENLEPGKVIAVNYPRFRVKTGDGLIEITEHDIPKIPKIGEYL